VAFESRWEPDPEPPPHGNWDTLTGFSTANRRSNSNGIGNARTRIRGYMDTCTICRSSWTGLSRLFRPPLTWPKATLFASPSRQLICITFSQILPLPRRPGKQICNQSASLRAHWHIFNTLHFFLSGWAWPFGVGLCDVVNTPKNRTGCCVLTFWLLNCYSMISS